MLYRQKYQTVESEASKGSEVLKERIGSLKHKVSDVLEEASKSEFAKKAGKKLLPSKDTIVRKRILYILVRSGCQKINDWDDTL